MKAAVVAISTGVLAISLALPALLFAQDEPPATPAAETTPPADGAAPPAEPPDPRADPAAAPGGEPVPPSEGEPAMTAGSTEAVATAEVAKGSASVQMQDFAFSPASVAINVGDSVSWSNVGDTDHDAVSDTFSTPTVSPGSSATETFSTAGTFSYICSFHPQMKGTIRVAGTSQGTTSDPGTTALPGTEAAATTAPDAAGSASGLPSTGQSEPPLLVVGLGLVGCGAIAALLARWREREDLL